MPYTETPETNALKQHIETILAAVPDFVEPAADKNQKPRLKINVIKDCAERGDIKLLAPLLNNPSVKKAFFTPVLDSFVFNTVRFKEFLEYSSACNSYSKYLGQKIGLYMGDIPLIDRSEVVLNFPFKDCILEGGQRKEDGLDTYFEYDEKEQRYTEKKSKRREVFYNEVLARDEIDSLFSPKAFCNAKRYESGKSSLCKKLNRNAELNKKRGLSEDTITDNLIIKGNNLLALHSLKEEFTGKVKLIYIDPPYNTGNDSFAYNDNFNHSSWLTFMKNRLEIARELLEEDGAIFVQCDDNEQAYLKLLMDDVFGRENFISTIVWKRKRGRDNSARWFSKAHEYFLVFAKQKSILNFNLIELDEETKLQYKNPDNDKRCKWR
ncbi:MAG: site-specific DNA-methyltransferase, partial [Treponema sp.]|uniref:site-specific DNA-methyltransferase n=1 Tax=Treponema sp. TaxID=166 RepID=UPI003618DD7F